jgi:hypothetical protein
VALMAEVSRKSLAPPELSGFAPEEIPAIPAPEQNAVAPSELPAFGPKQKAVMF